MLFRVIFLVFFLFADCARDMKFFSKYQLNFPLACNGYGNYEPIQNINGQYFCVDQDGFAVTDYLNVSSSSQQINCNQFLYYDHIPTIQSCSV